MLKFQPLTQSDFARLRPYMKRNPDRLCDLTAGVAFIWRDHYATEYAIHEGVLYFKVDYPGFGTLFTLPRGGDGEQEYRQIMDYCVRRELPVCFYPIPAREVGGIVKCFPCAQVMSDRNTYDYLYRAEDLKYFKGKKLSGPRNHVNRFLRTYQNWSLDPLEGETLDLARAFLDRYAQATDKDDEGFREDLRKTRQVLDHMQEYGLEGALLRTEERVVGFAIGEVVGDTLYVHMEKADRTVEGGYQMLVSQFAQCFARDGVEYINREDDAGDAGLRASKLAYRPVELLEKYAVLIPSGPCYQQAGPWQAAQVNIVAPGETNN